MMNWHKHNMYEGIKNTYSMDIWNRQNNNMDLQNINNNLQNMNIQNSTRYYQPRHKEDSWFGVKVLWFVVIPILVGVLAYVLKYYQFI